VQPGRRIPQPSRSASSYHETASAAAECHGPRPALLADDVRDAPSRDRIPEIHSAIDNAGKHAGPVGADFDEAWLGAGLAKRDEFVARCGVPCPHGGIFPHAHQARPIATETQRGDVAPMPAQVSLLHTRPRIVERYAPGGVRDSEEAVIGAQLEDACTRRDGVARLRGRLRSA